MSAARTVQQESLVIGREVRLWEEGVMDDFLLRVVGHLRVDEGGRERERGSHVGSVVDEGGSGRKKGMVDG